MSDAHQLFEWEGTDGSRRCLLIVEHTDKEPQAVDRKSLELCKYDDSSEEWKHSEMIDYIDESHSFGIPEDLVD